MLSLVRYCTLTKSKSTATRILQIQKNLYTYTQPQKIINTTCTLMKRNSIFLHKVLNINSINLKSIFIIYR